MTISGRIVIKNSLNLVESFHQLQYYLETLDSRKSGIDVNKSLILLNKNCIRIYLVAEAKSNNISLHVEVFPLINSHRKVNSDPSSNLHSVLASYILNLQFLAKLHKSGFELFFIEKEGIWYVRKLLEQEPDEEFENYILPP